MAAKKTAKQRLQAVIFDMDGVLCATDEYHYRSWQQTVDPHQIPFSRRDNDKLRGLTRRQSLEVILEGHRFLEIDREQILVQKNHQFLKLIEDMGPEDLLPGVADLLDELEGAGIKIGVASASRNAPVVLERLGIRDRVQALSDGNTVKRSKPAPDVYLQTASLLGINPAACLAVEDSQAGIEAARTAGMCVVGLGPPERVGNATLVVQDLSNVHLKDLLACHNRWQAAKQTSKPRTYTSLSGA